MRFGVREIAEVVLKAKSKMQLGSRTFYKNDPVIYFDTLKTSSLEGATSTVYATGGRGNTRLIAWEGERTLTFTFEDALLSPESFSILSGANLIAATEAKPIYVHTTIKVQVTADMLKNGLTFDGEAAWNGFAPTDPHYKSGADMYCMLFKNDEMVGEPCIPSDVKVAQGKTTVDCSCMQGNEVAQIAVDDIVLIDYYVAKKSKAQQMEITADSFSGNFYLEGSTLFRDEATGIDMPAEFIIPNGKIQSNFTFSMMATGDPSTFTFTMDAFPGYTKFDGTKKVLAAIQIIEDDIDDEDTLRPNCDSKVVTEIKDVSETITITKLSAGE